MRTVEKTVDRHVPLMSSFQSRVLKTEQRSEIRDQFLPSVERTRRKTDVLKRK